jgi:hypothetical protein
VAAQNAQFWLSASGTMPPGPEAPTVVLDIGMTAAVHVWGRPMTGKQLRNFSLNLVADTGGIDFLDNSITVHNLIDVDASRFEYIHDSTTDPPLVSNFDAAAGLPDAIEGIQGFTLEPTEAILGVGPACAADDMNCHVAGDGQPAWLIASVSLELIDDLVTHLHLQIGSEGMNHQTNPPGDYDQSGSVGPEDLGLWNATFQSVELLQADGDQNGIVDASDHVLWRDNLGNSGSVLEDSTLTLLTFGTDTEPVYNAGRNDQGGDRDVTLAGDTFDARIEPSAGSASGQLPSPNAAMGTIIPEPHTAWLLFIGMLVIALRRSPAAAVK